jgi:exopolysaccharide production protein ExoQ
VAIILAPILLLLPEINAMVNDFVFDTLGKDPTLTGRIFLWERADALIAQRPWLGYGYQAIWMGDSTETIALQRLTGITDGRVFHFHHEFRQIAVNTGLLGLSVFVVMMGGAILSAMRHALLKPDPANGFFFLLLLLTLARAFTDTALHPFSVHTLLYYSACVYAFRPERQVTAAVGFLSPTPRPAEA